MKNKILARCILALAAIVLMIPLNKINATAVDASGAGVTFEEISYDSDVVLQASDAAASEATQKVTIKYWGEDSTGKGWVDVIVDKKYLYIEGNKVTIPQNWFFLFGNKIPENARDNLKYTVTYKNGDDTEETEEQAFVMPTASGIKNPSGISLQNPADYDVTVSFESSATSYLQGINEINFIGIPVAENISERRVYYKPRTNNYDTVTFEEGQINFSTFGIYKIWKYIGDGMYPNKYYVEIFSENGTFSLLEADNVPATYTLPENLDMSVNENGDIVVHMKKLALAMNYRFAAEGANGKNRTLDYEGPDENGDILIPGGDIAWAIQRGILTPDNGKITIVLTGVESSGLYGTSRASFDYVDRGEAHKIFYYWYSPEEKNFGRLYNPEYYYAPANNVSLKPGKDVEIDGVTYRFKGWLLLENEKVKGSEYYTKLPNGTLTDISFVADVEGITIGGDDPGDPNDPGDPDEPANHDHEYTITVSEEIPATCTAKGKTAVKKCSKCAATIGGADIPKLDHTIEETIKAATTKADGSIVKACSVCHEEISRDVIAKAFVTIEDTAKYTGKAVKQAVKVTDANGKKISTNFYTVSYKNNIKVGKATVTVTFKGNYSGKVNKTFTIVNKSDIPGKVAGLKVTGASKAFKVSWKKGSANVDGYEIQYSTDKNFLSATKTVKISKAATVSKDIKKLKSKTTYYVRIRAYNKEGKTTAYSAWSAKKSVKTK